MSHPQNGRMAERIYHIPIVKLLFQQLCPVRRGIPLKAYTNAHGNSGHWITGTTATVPFDFVPVVSILRRLFKLLKAVVGNTETLSTVCLTELQLTGQGLGRHNYRKSPLAMAFLLTKWSGNKVTLDLQWGGKT